MSPRVLRLFLLLALVVAVSPASAAQRSSTLPPPGVRRNPAWLTVTTGPTTASQQLPPQLFAITPKSHADELTPFGFFGGLKRLNPTASAIWAMTLRRGGFANAFKPATWPPHLADFRVDHGWEGQPLPRIQQRLLALTTHGWSLDVRVYFGTQHPSRALLASVQAELSRLLLPGRR
jgi:hypothetical protein